MLGGRQGKGSRRRDNKREMPVVPALELWAQELKGSARAKRSGSRREEVSGDRSPSISFSGAAQQSGREGGKERPTDWYKNRKRRKWRDRQTGTGMILVQGGENKKDCSMTV